MVDYNKFAETFSKSRKNMKWLEIDYFIEYINENFNQKVSILDVGCGNWRLLKSLQNSNLDFSYLWIDSSNWMIDEAKSEFPNSTFQVLDMLNIDKVWQKFDAIFFIASFHHLENIKDRLSLLNKAKTLLNHGWLIMMANWNLLSENNLKKYIKSYIWKGDFNVKIGKFTRYYHWFQTTELEELFNSSGFSVVKNQFFGEGNNIVSIIKFQ